MIMSCAQRGHPENERRLAIRMLNILFEEAAALPAHKAKTEVQWHLINYWRVPSPGLSTSLRPLVAYTDASQHGIGLFITSIEQPFAWTWVRNHPSIPYGQTGEIVTSWAELIAVELSVHTLLLHRAYARASKHFIILSQTTQGSWMRFAEGIGRQISGFMMWCSVSRGGALRMESLWM